MGTKLGAPRNCFTSTDATAQLKMVPVEDDETGQVYSFYVQLWEQGSAKKGTLAKTSEVNLSAEQIREFAMKAIELSHSPKAA